MEHTTEQPEEQQEEPKQEPKQEQQQQQEKQQEEPKQQEESKQEEPKQELKQEQQAEAEQQAEPDQESEDFNWEKVQTKGFGEGYSEKERAQMEKLYKDTLTEIEEQEVVKGKVVGVSDRDVILNIGFKSDGLISASEFRDLPDLKIGDEVEVYIEEQENANGQLVLSRKKAKIVQAWKNIQEAYEKDLVIDGFIKRRTKGGLIADIYGVEAFLLFYIDLNFITDL